MAIKPAREGYRFVKKEGRHGDVRLANALGSNYMRHVSCGSLLEKEGWGIRYMDEGGRYDDTCAKMFY